MRKTSGLHTRSTPDKAAKRPLWQLYAWLPRDKQASACLLRAIRTLVFMLLCLSICVPIARAQLSSIRISDGPDAGTVSIELPWGDYTAIDIGGGDYIVLPTHEYDRRRAIAIARANGDRLALHNDPGATATFVSAYSYRAHVGPIIVDDVVPGIRFDDPVAGPDARDYRTVEVIWEAYGERRVGDVRCLLYLPGRKELIASGDALDASGEFRSMVFAVAKRDLTHRMDMVFVAPHEPPAVIPLRSVTYADYEYITHALDGLTPDRQQRQHIAWLQVLDPSLRTRAVRAAIRATHRYPTAFIGTPTQPTTVGVVALASPTGITIYAKIASTPQQREVGLRGQPLLAAHHGMLFVFATNDQQTFWMQNVSYPLDFVFITANGIITAVNTEQGVAPGTPDDTVPRFSGYARFVLALPAHEAAADGFAIGTSVTGLPP